MCVRMIIGVAMFAILPFGAPGQHVNPAPPPQLERGQWLYRDAEGRPAEPSTAHSVARLWNDVLLEAIRDDLARPTVHARNLYHVSAAMWDAWAAFDDEAGQVFHHERMAAEDVDAAREAAISYACYRVLSHRFASSPGALASQARFDALLASLGYAAIDTGTTAATPAALGNRVAQTIIAMGLADGANEAAGYANRFYEPVNPPLFPSLDGNPDIIDPNRWQPLSLAFNVDQSGNVLPSGVLPFLSPEWGDVTPFALTPADAALRERDGDTYRVSLDPGPPPLARGPADAEYRWGFELVIAWSAHLAPDGVLWDVSPASLGNAPLPPAGVPRDAYRFLDGGDTGAGHPVNPATGAPYDPQVVPRGDFARILAEFWADGPDSETPPGHWFAIANYVADHPLTDRRWKGAGEPLDPLEWDVRTYLALGGAMHDAAVATWSVKGWHDFLRPISAIRWMAERGQRSDPALPSYDPDGLDLIPGLIELVTHETTAPGGRHFNLRGYEGEIAIHAWRGPDFILPPFTEVAGVGWIPARHWWPYQRPSFVTPPFAGYVSGHSTFSRAAAEVLTRATGSPFFPAGIGEFLCPRDAFLVFERGPSVDVTLQWATYADAADQSGLSRIWGGIHPPADDLPGRRIGAVVGPRAFRLADRIAEGIADCPADLAHPRGSLDIFDILAFFDTFTDGDELAEFGGDEASRDVFDLIAYFAAYAAGC